MQQQGVLQWYCINQLTTKNNLSESPRKLLHRPGICKNRSESNLIEQHTICQTPMIINICMYDFRAKFWDTWSCFFFTKCKNSDYRAFSSSQSTRMLLLLLHKVQEPKSNNLREERNKKAYDLPAPETPMMIMARHLPIFHSILLLPCSVSFSSSVPTKSLCLCLCLCLSLDHKREVKLPELVVERSHSLVDEEALCAEATLPRMLPTVL